MAESTISFGKIICPACHGNGFIRKPVDAGRTIQEDCITCNNQGEMDITDDVVMLLEKSNKRLS